VNDHWSCSILVFYWGGGCFCNFAMVLLWWQFQVSCLSSLLKTWNSETVSVMLNNSQLYQLTIFTLSSSPFALLCVAASSFHRRRQSVTVNAALLSLGRQREMRYLHHYATTNSLPCHFVASWRLNYTLEHIIHTSTLVTVFTVRAGEHNFIVLTYVLTYLH